MGRGCSRNAVEEYHGWCSKHYIGELKRDLQDKVMTINRYKESPFYQFGEALSEFIEDKINELDIDPYDRECDCDTDDLDDRLSEVESRLDGASIEL